MNEENIRLIKDLKDLKSISGITGLVDPSKDTNIIDTKNYRILNLIGDHISYHNIKQFYSIYPIKTPIQIFTGSPKSFDRSPNMIISLYPEYGPLYVHASYIINIARPLINDKRFANYIQKELLLSKMIQAKGITFHVGKQVDMTLSDSLDNMKENIDIILKSLKDIDGPRFLLETPAGVGSELLYDIDTFILFCKQFKSKYFAVTIDTCHVFSTGYNPEEYISKILKSGIKIGLVHLNDSMNIKGSKKDRHAKIFTGKMDSETLLKVVKLCNKHSIDMVTEFT